ncbi:outer membrane protein assembly factor BamB family protein [Roseomonas elaeocarpi]|uniref:PQQ-binding-like beta-propeller repeat protein n=1 Tax=Roseomonas elaeocarpi TaxID=907779 RepID=A0ABV6JQ58_9PROT
MQTTTRRAALLGLTGLLAGCDTLDSIFSTRKDKLPGERRSILAAEKGVDVDPAISARAVDLPPAAPVTQWPQIGGNLAHAAGNVALPAGTLRPAWTASVGTGSAYRRRLTTGPICSADTVFASDAYGVLGAWDLGTGRRRWSFDTKPEKDDVGALGVGAALDGDTLYIASGMAEILAVEVATGKLRWRAAAPAPMRGAPTVSDGRIFVITLDNNVVGFSAEDGRKLWNFQGQSVSAVPYGLAAPAVSGDNVVAGLPTGEVVCLRPDDGRTVWTEALAPSRNALRSGIADLSGVHALPVVAGEQVIVVGENGTTMSVDLRSGRRLWEREVGGSVTPAVAGDWIFVLSTDQELVAMTRTTGQIRWITPLNAPPPPGQKPREPARFAAPMLLGSQILVPGSGGEALVVDPSDGAVTRRIPLGGSVTLPGAVAGATLVLLSDEGSLIALRG